MARTYRRVLSPILGLAALLYAPSPALAQGYLGATLRDFAVLAGAAVTCTGPSTVAGDVGVSPSSSISGFPVPCTTTGTLHAAGATAATAQNELTAAFNTLAGQACGLDLTGSNLGGLTLLPGTYCFSSSAQLTGTLTLDGQGDPNAAWVFQIGSTLTTASGSSVEFIGSGNPCGAQWQVGTSATLGTGTSFAGNILAQAAITLNTGADLTGRALARVEAVTLDTNDISFAACGAGGGAGGAPPPFPEGGSAVPTLPALALGLLAAALAVAGLTLLRRRSLTQA